MITICAVIGGADDWVSVAAFARAKEDWFKSLLELPHGIPGVDTYRRVFSALNPKEFEKGFRSWVRSLKHLFPKEVIALDGKALRRAPDEHASGAESIRLVNAWASKNQLLLGQERVSGKSNEITAIPKLLEVLDISGAIVTIDAMGCQESIAEQIVAQGGDYVLAVKGNQGATLEAVEYAFKHNQDSYSHYETFDVGHGRLETRRYQTITQVDVIQEWSGKQWEGMQSIGMVEAIREDKKTGKRTTEKRYYLSSLSGDAQEFAVAIREHWSVENRLHWSLDMSFREDESRMRKGHSAQNFSLIRKLALSLLKRDTVAKSGIKNKRLRAGWDERYLLHLLSLD